jgi:hypothetical protein
MYLVVPGVPVAIRIAYRAALVEEDAVSPGTVVVNVQFPAVTL